MAHSETLGKTSEDEESTIVGVRGNKMKQVTLTANQDNVMDVLSFVRSSLMELGCPKHVIGNVVLAVEEAFVNIALYAYAPNEGEMSLTIEGNENPTSVSLTFRDHGVPFNPLARAEPDITLPGQERPIGGLGILMYKRLMDEVTYEYADGQNILTFKKRYLHQ